MTIHETIKGGKIQHDCYREASKLFGLCSDDISKYDHLTGKEMLSPWENRIIEQAKFTCSPKVKSIEEHGKKLVKAFKFLDFPNNLNEIK